MEITLLKPEIVLLYFLFLLLCLLVISFLPVALVYGQLNEPTGAQIRVGLTALDHGS